MVEYGELDLLQLIFIEMHIWLLPLLDFVSHNA